MYSRFYFLHMCKKYKDIHSFFEINIPIANSRETGLIQIYFVRRELISTTILPFPKHGERTGRDMASMENERLSGAQLFLWND